MRYLVNESLDPYFNMAFDEWCLENLSPDEPVFYLWRNSPAVIIGLNQNAYGEVNLPYLEEQGILLARRVTGGGAVYHDLENLNYTIIGKEVTTEPFVKALRSLGVAAETTGRNDIFVDGHKISGYAKRVWKTTTMVHGTLMYDVDIDTLVKVLDAPGSKLNAKGIASVKSRVTNLKDYLPSFRSLLELKDTLFGIMAGDDSEIVLSSDQIAEVKSLRDSKFSLWEWNYGRSPEADFSNRMKLSCGTVEAHICVERGIITGLCFTGDFIGKKASDTFAGQLIGLSYKKDVLEKALGGIKPDDYFEGVRSEEILKLLLNFAESCKK